MPPANDDFANAQVISGVTGTLIGDNTGATAESPDDPMYTVEGFGMCTVWYAYTPVSDGTLIVATDTGGASPISDTAMGLYEGASLATLTALDVNDDYNGFYSQVSGTVTAGTTYYVCVTGYSDSEFGTFTLNWTGPRVTYVVDANSDPGVLVANGGTVTDTGTGITDSQYAWAVDVGWAQSYVTPSFYVRDANLPPPGQYRIELKVKNAAYPTQAEILIRVNGLQWVAAGNTYRNDNNEALVRFTGPPVFSDTTAAGQDTGHAGGPECYGIKAGDVLEFCIFNKSGPTTYEVEQVVFTVLTEGGAAGAPIDLLDIPDLPLGATSWNASDVPDLLYFTFAESNTSGSHDLTKDICVTSDGTVWLAISEHFYAPSSPPGYNPAHYNLSLWKYPVGGPWTLISNDVTGTGPELTTPHWPGGTIRCETDGTSIYIVWGQEDGTSFNSFNNYQWHCQKYTPGSGFTELGTGQARYPAASRTQVYCSAGEWGSNPHVKVGPDGKVWVGWAENADDPLGADYDYSYSRVHLAWWNGSSWVYVDPPDPPNLHGADFVTHYFDVRYITTDDQQQIDFTFCHHDGPSNWPSIIYSAVFLNQFGSGQTQDGTSTYQFFIYSEYDGSSWSNTLQFTANDVFPTGTDHDLDNWLEIGTYEDFRGRTDGQWQQGMCLIDNGQAVVFAADFGSVVSGPERLLVMSLLPDGSAFTPYPGPYKQPDLCFRTDYRTVNSSTNGGTGDVIDTYFIFWPWTDPGMGDLVFDSKGHLWLMTTFANNVINNPIIVTDQDPGSNTGWTLASIRNAILPSAEDALGFSRAYMRDDVYYVVTTTINNLTGGPNNIDRPIVFKAPIIRNAYTPWGASTRQPAAYAVHAQRKS